MSDRDNQIECDVHGPSTCAYVCCHLVGDAENLGFNLGYDTDHLDELYPDAWCDSCEEVLEQEGDWNKRSEAFADIKVLCSGCYQETRNRNWIQDDDAWSELTKHVCSDLHEKQEKFLAQYKVGEYDRWDRDEENGILVFSKDGKPQVEADFHFAGSYSRKSSTWMWAWANKSFEDKVRRASLSTRYLGDDKSFLSLSAHFFEATEQEVSHLVAVMAKQLGAIGTYRECENDLYTYMVITDARWVKKKRFFGFLS